MVVHVSPQNITLNPPEQIEMEVSSSFPTTFGAWFKNGVRIFLNPEGRVTINQTESTSKLVIFPTTYNDSGEYEFRIEGLELEFPPAVSFFISLPPRSVESELSMVHSGTSGACVSAYHPLHSVLCRV